MYTAIRAPRGLSETIYHAWHHNGAEMDTVDIMTDGGQRLGLIRFTVSEDADKATVADSTIQPSGLSALNLRRFIPGKNGTQLMTIRSLTLFGS